MHQSTAHLAQLISHHSLHTTPSTQPFLRPHLSQTILHTLLIALHSSHGRSSDTSHCKPPPNYFILIIRQPFIFHHSLGNTHPTTIYHTTAPHATLISCNHLIPLVSSTLIRKCLIFATFKTQALIIPLISHHSSRSTHPTTIHHATTHHTTLITSTHLIQLIKQRSSQNACSCKIRISSTHHTSHLTPLVTQPPTLDQSLQTIPTHHSSHTSHHRAFITQPLMSHHSSRNPHRAIPDLTIFIT